MAMLIITVLGLLALFWSREYSAYSAAGSLWLTTRQLFDTGIGGHHGSEEGQISSSYSAPTREVV